CHFVRCHDPVRRSHRRTPARSRLAGQKARRSRRRRGGLLARGLRAFRRRQRIVAFSAVVPMIKKLWTASFAIFAAGWTCWLLAIFYAIIEGLAFKAWAFPFVVVGMNSIAMYVFAQIF